MKEIMNVLKSLFAGDVEKEKKIDDFAATLKDDPPVREPSTTSANPELSELKTVVMKLSEDNKSLMKLIQEKEQREKDRDEQIKIQAEKEFQEKVDKIIKEATVDGRIPPKNEKLLESYKKMLAQDYDAAKLVIEALPKTAASSNADKSTAFSDDKTPKTPDAVRQSLIDSAKAAFADSNS